MMKTYSIHFNKDTDEAEIRKVLPAGSSFIKKNRKCLLIQARLSHEAMRALFPKLIVGIDHTTKN